MGSLLSLIADSKNRQTLSWIGGALMAIVAGCWAVVTYIWPAHETAGTACAQEGSVASNGNVSGVTLNYNGGTTVAANREASPCVKTGSPASQPSR